jgi:hypothetical protein
VFSPLLSQANSLFILLLLCSCPSALTGEFSAFPFAFTPTLRLFRALSGAFQQPLHLPPSLHRKPASAFSPPCQEKGGSPRRGSLYYNALSRHDRLTPSQLALIASRISGPRHNSQGSSEPPSSPPHSIHGNFPVKEETPPSRERTPLLTNPLAPPKINPQDPVFGDGSCMVEEEIPPSWQVEEHMVITSEDKEVEHLCSMQIDSRRSTSNLFSKFGKSKMISCTHSASSAKDWTFCSMH